MAALGSMLHCDDDNIQVQIHLAYAYAANAHRSDMHAIGACPMCNTRIHSETNPRGTCMAGKHIIHSKIYVWSAWSICCHTRHCRSPMQAIPLSGLAVRMPSLRHILSLKTDQMRKQAWAHTQAMVNCRKALQQCRCKSHAWDPPPPNDLDPRTGTAETSKKAASPWSSVRN